MKITSQVLVLLILGLASTTISRCHGRPGWFFSRRLSIRGGSDSFPAYENSQYRGPDSPPDLPNTNYGDQQQTPPQRGTQDQYQYNSQPQRYGEAESDPRYNQHSQHYPQQNDPYYSQQPPPGAYGVENGRGPPSLPSSYGQDHYPSLPDDPSMFREDDMPENMNIDTAFGMGDGTNDEAGGMDLAGFDKEYILKGLAKLYKEKILPLERDSGYAHFHSPPLSPADFVAPPQVLLLGQYR